ncbi:MAG: translational machinery protein [Roseiarcus sp.]
MQGQYHAVVWIDHRLARVFHFSGEDADKIVVHADHPVREFKRSDKRIGRPLAEDQAFLEVVTKTLADAEAILVVGPSDDKYELVKHIQRVHPKMMVKVEGVESADHPSEGELVAHARRFAKAADRMRPTS